MVGLNEAEARAQAAAGRTAQAVKNFGGNFSFSLKAVYLIVFSLAGLVLCGYMWYWSATSTIRGVRLAFALTGDTPWLWVIPVCFTCVQIGALPFIKKDRMLLYFWATVSLIDIVTTMSGALDWLWSSPQLSFLGLIGGLLAAFIIGVGLGFTPEPLSREVFWKYLCLGFRAIARH